MPTNVFSYEGECGFSGVWTGITWARSFNRSLLYIPQGGTKWMRYTSGNAAVLHLGERLNGVGSSISCQLAGYVWENGIQGSGDSGIILVDNLVGNLGGLSSDTLVGSISTGRVVINQNFLPIMTVCGYPKAALISVEVGAINFTLSGIIPTVTSGTNYGINLVPGQSYLIRGMSNVSNFSCINAVNANGAIVKYELFF